jgi:hypothetical protein
LKSLAIYGCILVGILQAQTVTIPQQTVTIPKQDVTITLPAVVSPPECADSNGQHLNYTGGKWICGTSTANSVVTYADAVTVSLSEDYYQANAQFSITIDGVVVEKAGSVTAIHGKGTQAFTYTGNWPAAATHTISIHLMNDFYGGTATTDLNLYVDSVTYNGKAVVVTNPAQLSPATGASVGTFGLVPVVTPPVVTPPVSTTPVSTSKKVGTSYTSNPEAVPSGAVSVLTLGAKGDGKTDDSGAINAALKSNSKVLIPEATYKLSTAVNIPAGATVFGQGAAVFLGNAGAYPLAYLNGDNITLKGITFDGGAVIGWDNKTNLDIEYNTFRNHTAAGTSNIAQNNLLYIGQAYNSIIRNNTFSNVMPPANVSVDPAVSGSDPDYFGGAPKSAIWMYGLSNTTIDHNTFDLCQEGIKFASGSTVVWPGTYIGYNLMTRIHRMPLETQIYHSGAVFEYNVIKDWYKHYWEAYGVSWASPQSTNTIIRGNYLVGGIYNATYRGLGIEYGGVNGQVYDNTIMGAWGVSSLMVFGGSKNNSIHDNRACSTNTDATWAAGVAIGLDEGNGTVTGTTLANNTAISGVGQCPASWVQYDLSL